MSQVAALKDIFEIAVRCRGPKGRHVVVEKGSTSSQYMITTVGPRIFEGIQDPICRLLMASTVHPQHKTWGDGSLLALAVAARLSAFGIEACSSIRSRMTVVAAYKTAMKWCMDYFESLQKDGTKDSLCSVKSVDWGSLQSVMSLAKSILNSKPVCSMNRNGSDIVCAAIVTAFLASIEATDATCIPYPRVKFVGIIGSHSDSSESITGVLLDTPLPCGAEGLMPMRNAKVAVFNISLVPCYHKGALTSVQCNVVKECPDLHAIEVTEGKENEEKLEMDFLLNFVIHLKNMGVEIVACQKVIDPEVSHALIAQGILPLPRLSLRHIDSVVLCSRASPISKITDLGFEGKLGLISKAETCRIKQKSFVHLLPANDSPMLQTVVICGLTEHTIEETKRTAEACLKVLWRALNDPRVVQGCGVSELEIAKEIRRKISKSKIKHGTLEGRAIHAVADALEEIARPVVAANATCYKSIKGALGAQSLGNGKIPVGYLSDLLGAKISALAFAIESASTLLRISNVIIET